MRATPKTFHLWLIKPDGMEFPVDEVYPTRADARKAGRRMTRQGSRFERFRIDSKLVERKRRNANQHPSIAAPALLKSPRWTAIYRSPDHIQEVVVTSEDEPEDERRFRVVGHGRPVFKLASKTKLNQPPPRKRRAPATKEDASTMAKQKRRKSKDKNAKAAEAEAVADDEALLDDDELNDLDDLDELEGAEPDSEDTSSSSDDSDSSSSSESSSESSDDSDSDDSTSSSASTSTDKEDDVSEELPTTVKELRKLARERGLASDKAKAYDKGKLTKWLKKHPATEEESSESSADTASSESEEKSSSKKSKSKSKSKSRKGQAPPTRELPKGKLGAEAIAKAAKTDARTVRQFLRKMDDADKYKVEGRWAFTQKQVDSIAKKIKKSKS